MPTVDDNGLTLTTVSDGEAYRDAVRLMLSAWPGAAERLDAAIGEDPDFGLAYAARARLYAIHGEGAAAKAAIERASNLVSRATDRERSHVDVLAHAVKGQSKKALERALAHAEHWPRDVIVLGLPLGAFGLFAFSGMPDHDQARVDLLERHAGHFAADDWWFLTYRGWSLAENGAVARGRDMLEQAIELRRENANGLHGLAHAMYEGGAGGDAERLIADWLPDYDRSGILHGHIAWHAALVALERGDADTALQIYADQVQPSVSLGMPINIVSDAASLLWRLSAYGHSVPKALWREIGDYSANEFPTAGHAFIDTHMAMIEAMIDNRDAFDMRLAALDQMVASGSLGAGAVVPEMSRALRAFAEGNNRGAIRVLEPITHEVIRIGGSGAQREVIEDTLLVALMRAGEMEKARALLDRRLHRRPSPRDSLWHSRLGG